MEIAGRIGLSDFEARYFGIVVGRVSKDSGTSHSFLHGVGRCMHICLAAWERERHDWRQDRGSTEVEQAFTELLARQE